MTYLDEEDELGESWVTIPEFPRYAVSNLGHVMNIRTEKLVKPQFTPQGIVYVPLHGEDRKQARSLKVLVAKAFVEGETDIFDTPINKDGVKSNNNADNLLWRPRWFAIKYARQFNTEYINSERGPVFDRDTGEMYATVREAAMANGLLCRDVFRTAYSYGGIFPTQQRFRIPGFDLPHSV
jgi:NUMOD4 motif